ncbi:diguanylate cyclase domain-containing protein [Gallaecimonas xiamenensis]|uniref:diguanylate cyclase domain-containing protein n=1 Tax=Gallaecimonas xiamenensis TaxID=1207039 RepID=UPI00178C505E|nr:diguanylate cyclase [Gallaecimonas xiamenensis]
MSGTLVQRLLTVAFAYFVAGWLGIQLALPPGYASPIWPAAGVALVALLTWGHRIWPGIFFGSFLTNALVVGQPEALLSGLWSAWLVPLAIASGATLQGLFGAWLLAYKRRWQLATLGEILQLMGKGALLSSVVAASIGQVTLSLAGVNPPGVALTGWLTWWTGDAMGVALLSPFILLWANRPGRSRLLWTGLTMVMLVAGLLWSTQQIASSQRSRVGLELQRQSDVLAAAVQSRTDHYLNSLTGLAQIFRSSEHVSRLEFHRAASELLQEMPGLRALEWVPRVAHQERLAMEEKASSELGRAFHFTVQGPDGKMIPAPPTAFYYPIYYLEPLEGNERALGYAPGSHPGREAAMTRAMVSGRTSLSDVLSLVQSKNGKSFLAFRAVRHADGTMMGYVLAVIDANSVLSGALNAIAQSPLQMSAQDKASQQYFLPPPSEDFDTGQGLWVERSLSSGGREWLLRFHYPDYYVLTQANAGLWLILVGGLLLVSVVGCTVLLVTGQAFVIGKQVRLRTRELEQANQRIRERERFLGSLVENLPLTLQVKNADDLTYVQVNRAAEDLLGRSRDQLIDSSDRDLLPEAEAEATIASDRAAIHSGRLQLVDKEAFTTPNGVRWLRTRKVPLCDDEQQVRHLLILREDITEALINEDQVRELNRALSERNHELAEVNQRLEQLSRIDALTQLVNRRIFDQELEEEWLRCARQSQPLTVLMIDIDFFKRFNDSAGHLEGDRCLQQVAFLLMSSVRRAGDVVARYGGEEFAMILPGSGLLEAKGLANKIQANIRQAAIRHPDSPISSWVTLSIGIASGYPSGDLKGVKPLLEQADKALYQAKEGGRDRYQCVQVEGQRQKVF